MVFGPKGHFFGIRCGKSEFSDGIIPFSKLHDLFSRYQRELVPKGTENETKTILSFFETLGSCRRLTDPESASLGVEPNGFYEFPELTPISELPLLPSETTQQQQQPSDTDKDKPSVVEHKIHCVVFDSMNRVLFSRLKKKLIPFKDPKYKSFSNSLILSRHENMELWFQQDEKLTVVIRGATPTASVLDMGLLVVCYRDCSSTFFYFSKKTE